MNQQAMSSVDVAADLAGGGVVDVEAVQLHLQLAVGQGAQLQVGLAEDHEEVAGAGGLEELLVGGVHGEVGVHARDEDGEVGPLPGLFVDVGAEGEGADDEHGEALALARLLGGLLDPLGVDGAVLGADGDGGAEGLAGGVGVLADGLDVGAGVGLDALEDEALVLEGVLHAGLAQVVEDDR